MKFEYKLNYDFVNGVLSFQVTKMPESLRHTCEKNIKIKGNDYRIASVLYPQLCIGAYASTIYLPGNDTGRNDDEAIAVCDADKACEAAKVLEKFQSWVENEYEEPKIEMTIAEIEKKLGIKNLKIVKEHENDE